jgi:hypothetical protein
MNATKPTIVGYRNGDQWYDANGKALASGLTVSRASSSGRITPLIADKTQDIQEGAKFNPDGSFVDYKPQINIMPRLQFSFNLTDKALFFAHYDVLTQRPQAGGFSIANPIQYLWFDRFANGGFINNPDLKPEKTIDFELGFRQKVSNTSAITISAYYREFKDMVQLVKRYYTYPGTGENYITMGNVDFATVKGFAFDYDLRRTGNIQMKLNYTLQFAEGTGSDNQSQSGLVSADQPNFRTIFPLNYDARHTINLTLDWRYGHGGEYNGPYIGKSQIFSNAGINFTLTARSGTPYTKQSNATPDGLTNAPSRPVTEGSLNGARLPWTFRLNTKIDKEFNVKVGKKKEGKEQRNLNFNIYCQIQNLINAKNILGVYRYTGNPSDDGYLGSPTGVVDVNSRPYPESYKDLYRAYINRSSNYSKPYSVRFGLIMGF